MPIPVKIAIPVLACLGLAACGPNPIIARDPVPPPPPGMKVRCSTMGAPFGFRWSDCDPVYEKVVPRGEVLTRKG